MNEVDPEKRIADLERQLADQQRGAASPPALPWQPAHAAPESVGASRKASRRWSVAAGVWTGMVLLWIGVGGLGYVVYYSYGYWVGTSTTATVDHCEWGDDRNNTESPSSLYCT